jgi:hypothetical protein
MSNAAPLCAVMAAVSFHQQNARQTIHRCQSKPNRRSRHTELDFACCAPSLEQILTFGNRLPFQRKRLPIMIQRHQRRSNLRFDGVPLLASKATLHTATVELLNAPFQDFSVF